MRYLIPLLVLVSACDYGFEKQSHISKLRVLAVRAEPPEVVLVPGQPVPQVELTGLAIGPSGEPVEMHGIALESTSATSALLDLNQAHLEMPASIPPLVPLSIGFSASSAGQSMHGFATLNLRTSADSAPARNPTVEDLQADGGSLSADGSGTVHAGAKVQLTPFADDDQVTFSFYSTAGDLDSLRATAAQPEVDWTAPATTGPVQLWIVARDGRGGVGWLARTVQVVP